MRLSFFAMPQGMRPAALAMASAMAGLCGHLAVYAEILPNGTTATSVNTQPGGLQIVTPAKPKGDVSYNAFSRFDVGAAGATFANREANARNIVAEVFSPLPSRIEGPVSVDGPRANLILANQNGVRVNGASFVNFGSLALTTGAVSLRDVELAPGTLQRYVDVSTRGGDILIEPGGLSANLIRLELIAKKVGIAGPVTNAFTSATAQARLVAGNSDASFDTLASPTDNLTPWTTYKSQPAQPDSSISPAIAIDITAGSTVRSGRVEVIVTDAGAGVRNAGTVSATTGDFRITSSGLIEQRGGRMEAAGNVRIKTREFAQSNDGDRASAVVAGGSARIDADGAIRNSGGVIQGQTRSGDDADTPYAVLLNAGSEIDVATPLGAKEGAVVFGAADDVLLRGKDGIRVTNARVVSNGGLTAQSDQALDLRSLHVDGAARRDWSGSSLLTRKNGYVIDRGALADADHQGYLVSNGDMAIQTGSMRNDGGTVFSSNGMVDLQVAGDVVNRAHSIGTFGVSNRCFLFICKRTASSTEQLVGGQISAGTKLNVKAGGKVLNDGGQFLSVQGMQVESTQNIALARPVQRSLQRADGLKALFGDTWARLYATDQGGGFTSQQGRLILKGATRQEGGFFSARDGVEGDIEVVREPHRDPITIDKHLGILRW